MSENNATNFLIELLKEYKEPISFTAAIISIFILKPLKNKIKSILKMEKKKEIVNFNFFCLNVQRDYKIGEYFKGRYKGEIFDSLDRLLDICRKQNESLVINFCDVKAINDFAFKDFVDIIFKLLRDNVVPLKIIFPKKEKHTERVGDLYKKIYNLTKHKQTINITTDVRKEERK